MSWPAEFVETEAVPEDVLVAEVAATSVDVRTTVNGACEVPSLDVTTMVERTIDGDAEAAGELVV